MSQDDTRADHTPRLKAPVLGSSHQALVQWRIEPGAYCRDNGLKPHQLTCWEKIFAQPDAGVSFVPLHLTSNLPVPGRKFIPHGFPFPSQSQRFTPAV